MPKTFDDYKKYVMKEYPAVEKAYDDLELLYKVKMKIIKIKGQRHLKTRKLATLSGVYYPLLKEIEEDGDGVSKEELEKVLESLKEVFKTVSHQELVDELCKDPEVEKEFIKFRLYLRVIREVGDLEKQKGMDLEGIAKYLEISLDILKDVMKQHRNPTYFGDDIPQGHLDAVMGKILQREE